jgi:hypothetical protein
LVNDIEWHGIGTAVVDAELGATCFVASTRSLSDSNVCSSKRAWLQRVGRGRLARFDLERQVHPLVPAVLRRMVRPNALDPNPRP